MALAIDTSVQPAETAYDSRQAERFAERLLGALNEASLIAMTSIGHRTGLFDVMAEMPPATVAEIAARAGLVERYVREWLAVMVTSRVVVYDAETATYRLPAEHAAFLTRAATPDNIAVTAQMIPLTARVEDAIIERFRKGGGLHYHDYPRFHEVMAEDSGQTVVAALFDHILPLVPGLAGRLENGIDVVDAGCGSGRALVTLAERFPKSRFLGLDLCAEAIERGREAAREKGLANLHFEMRDLSTEETLGAYDLVTAFDAVHDQKDPQGLLDAVARSLKPGGVFLMQDIAGSSRLEKNLDHPPAPFLYTISCLHCTPVSLAQGGPGLGTMWGEELAMAMLERAGFREVTVERLPHDPFNAYFIAR
ncbi:class I SAM-dependent methyltransferase [Rhodospirillaceae bacterium SYSU D60014]|uniref:class I SAM-dependent methyltransferase n=1 Tax=Virgifigura deserti TaxID=2268457 RepID=UPI000E669619